jgi:hypothetical protein
VLVVLLTVLDALRQQFSTTATAIQHAQPAHIKRRQPVLAATPAVAVAQAPRYAMAVKQDTSYLVLYAIQYVLTGIMEQAQTAFHALPPVVLVLIQAQIA